MKELTIQLGKNGVTENFFATLRSYFKYNVSVKIIVLQNFPDRTKEKVKEISLEISKTLGEKYTCKTIGFTISVKKWKKSNNKL